LEFEGQRCLLFLCDEKQMNFPTFINGWIISNRFLRYTIFWYWFRLINHSDFRMDDNVRNSDFWLNLNSGYEDMNCKWEFEKFWRVGSYAAGVLDELEGK